MSRAARAAESLPSPPRREPPGPPHQFADAVQDQVDDLLADGVVATGIVVGRVFLPGDQLLRVEELPVGPRAHLICGGQRPGLEDAGPTPVAGSGTRPSAGPHRSSLAWGQVSQESLQDRYAPPAIFGSGGPSTQKKPQRGGFPKDGSAQAALRAPLAHTCRSTPGVTGTVLPPWTDASLTDPRTPWPGSPGLRGDCLVVSWVAAPRWKAFPTFQGHLSMRPISRGNSRRNFPCKE